MESPDDVYIFLEGSFGDHLRGLAQTGVNHLHAVISQGAGDDFGAAVVAIQAGLGNLKRGSSSLAYSPPVD